MLSDCGPSFPCCGFAAAAAVAALAHVLTGAMLAIYPSVMTAAVYCHCRWNLCLRDPEIAMQTKCLEVRDIFDVIKEFCVASKVRLYEHWMALDQSDHCLVNRTPCWRGQANNEAIRT